MRRLYGMALAATFATALTTAALVNAVPAFANPPPNPNAPYPSPYPNGPYPYPNGPYPYPNGPYNAGPGNDPHGCINPAGHVRGWCKHGGSAGFNGNYYGGANAQVSGTVISVSGSRVTILQGLLSTVTIDDSIALNSGRAYNVYPGRSITAYGSWRNGTFYATSIT